MKINQKGFSIVEILAVIVIVELLGAVGWLVFDRQNNKADEEQSNNQTQTETPKSEAPKQEETKPATLVKGTFGENGEYGTLQAAGYATTVKRNEAFCEIDCQQLDYVFFNITRTENTNIFNYLKSINGNSFVQDNAIGLGCLASGQISYSNNSESKGMQEYKLSKEDTATLMSATAEKPTTIDLESLPPSGGRGAPACYSHFATIKVLN